MSNTDPIELRQEAARHEQEAHDSFDRCDTDGALSQWAHGASAIRLRAEAELAENDGRAVFTALFTTSGELTEAKLISGRWGMFWKLPDGDTMNLPLRQATLRRKGYQAGWVSRPAKVDIHAPFAGAAVTAYNYPVGDWSEAVVVDDGSTWTHTHGPDEDEDGE